MMFRVLLAGLTFSSFMFSGSADIRIGGAVNVFQHFGDLSSVVKVNPHHGPNWFSDHDSVDIFEEVLETRSPTRPVEDPVFNGDFQLELCDNLDQLKEAFFKSYQVERCEKPWRAFTGGWSNAASARHFGLNTSHVVGTHSYVLVRLIRYHQLVRLTPHIGLRLNNWTAEHTKLVVPGEANSVLEFFKVSGSHYVDSYTTGNSLYQVFVFTPSVYEDLRKVMREYEASSQDLDSVLSFFTPWHVEHMGRIMSATGNSSLEQWATEHLQSHVLIFFYASLLKLHRAPDILQELNYLLGNDALLSVSLKTLSPLFTDDAKRLWFEEILDNHLKMWELNV